MLSYRTIERRFYARNLHSARDWDLNIWYRSCWLAPYRQGNWAKASGSLSWSRWDSWRIEIPSMCSSQVLQFFRCFESHRKAVESQARRVWAKNWKAIPTLNDLLLCDRFGVRVREAAMKKKVFWLNHLNFSEVISKIVFNSQMLPLLPTLTQCVHRK